MVLGLFSGQVRLARDHGAWAAAFEDEAARIVAVLGDGAVAIEHVGSTSMAGVPAKPILDLLIGVEDFEAARVCVAPMESLGYVFRGEYGITRRHYFVKSADAAGRLRTHHVHMVELGSEMWTVTLRFRDRLRAHADLAAEYGRAKLDLARIHADDRAAYQREKDKVVERLLAL